MAEDGAEAAAGAVEVLEDLVAEALVALAAGSAVAGALAAEAQAVVGDHGG